MKLLLGRAVLAMLVSCVAARSLAPRTANARPTKPSAEVDLAGRRLLTAEVSRDASSVILTFADSSCVVGAPEYTAEDASPFATTVASPLSPPPLSMDDPRELLEVRSLPLRNYLLQNVIPTLTEGLIEVCKVKPDDPIDHLAEWLFQNNPVEEE